WQGGRRSFSAESLLGHAPTHAHAHAHAYAHVPTLLRPRAHAPTHSYAYAHAYARPRAHLSASVLVVRPPISFTKSHTSLDTYVWGIWGIWGMCPAVCVKAWKWLSAASVQSI